MRQSPNSNTNSLSQLPDNQWPKVTLITCGYKDIKQTYSNIDHIIIEDTAPPKAFNEGLQSSNNIIYGFLDRESDFASEYTIEIIVKTMLKHPELGGVYTDNILNEHPQYFPSYSYANFQQYVINTPFFCHREVKVQFDETKLTTYYHEALKSIGSRTILHHIPEALFTINTLPKNILPKNIVNSE